MQSLHEFYDEHCPRITGEEGEEFPSWAWIETALGNKIHVSSGSTYELQDEENKFITWTSWLARKGTDKTWAHISLD
jgi:hypothetical protein